MNFSEGNLIYLWEDNIYSFSVDTKFSEQFRKLYDISCLI